MKHERRVSIVVPVYNGADHLHECLSSIANQTFTDWDAVVVNNCSTDGTGDIAEKFARSDPRFRVMHCTEFLPQAGNYNRAVASASPGAEFIKIVEADNQLWPECLERMVDVASSNDQIGVVGCYYVMGHQLHGAGLHHTTQVASGIDVGRTHLAGQAYYLGCPSTLLFSAKALKAVSPAFKPDMFYDDVDLCLRLLQKWKFGFVHQVLAFIRHDNSGAMSKFWSFDYVALQRYLLLITHGQAFFEDVEFQGIFHQAKGDYYRCLGKAAATGRGRKYWDFHRKALGAAGENIRVKDLGWPIVRELLELILNPKTSCERALRRLRFAVTPRKPGVAYSFDRPVSSR